MLHSRSNGQSIVDYIPPDLKRMFYKNPASVHASHNGLDPYGFSTNGLALYLSLWALKGTGFQSVDAYGHTATATNTTWQPYGRNFGGADYITIPDNDALDPSTTTASWLFWVRSTDTSTRANIILKGVAVTHYAFDIARITAKRYQCYLSGVVATDVENGTDVENNTWHLIGVTYDSGGGANNYIIYLDGVNDGQATVVNNIGANTDEVVIGANSGKTIRFWNGDMGEIWIYNRTLSAGEMLHIKNSTAWRYA